MVGETITVTLDLIDPNGIVISTYVQSSNGFPNPALAATAELDNDSTAARQVILQLPWTEAQNSLRSRFYAFFLTMHNGLSQSESVHLSRPL